MRQRISRGDRQRVRRRRDGGPGAVRVLLIGDVAGHLDVLRWALGAHGVDLDTATIPDGLVVVQAGDLVHRGPDSAGVIALVDRFLRGPHAEPGHPDRADQA